MTSQVSEPGGIHIKIHELKNIQKLTYAALLLTTIIILSSAVSNAASANGTWVRAFGGPQYDAFNAVINTSDGGYAAVGYTSSYTTNNTTHIYFVKTDASGNIEWNKTYGNSTGDVGYQVVQTSDGGYAIAGYTTTDSGAMKVYLVRTDIDGNLLWNKTFNVGDSQDGAYSIAKTSDGGFILTGFTYVYDSGGWDAFLLKTGSMGNVTWIRNYGGLFKDAAHSVQQTSDGGYIFTGYTKSYGVAGGDNNGVGAENLWLVKTDANGTEQLNKTFGGKDYDDGFAVHQMSDGGYIVAGTTKSFGPNGTTRDYNINNTARAYLIRTDSGGNEIWNHTYGGNTNTGIFSMQAVKDGFVLAGTTFSNNGDADVIAIKTDLNGTGQWAYTYGGSYDDYGYSICTAEDGYVIAGYTSSYGNGATDGYLTKINGDGSLPATPGQGLPISAIILSIVAVVCAITCVVIVWKWILKK